MNFSFAFSWISNVIISFCYSFMFYFTLASFFKINKTKGGDTFYSITSCFLVWGITIQNHKKSNPPLNSNRKKINAVFSEMGFLARAWHSLNGLDYFFRIHHNNKTRLQICLIKRAILTQTMGTDVILAVVTYPQRNKNHRWGASSWCHPIHLKKMETSFWNFNGSSY